ncbi:hypothetical protein DL765_002249 [Monosporascus sp. GIB2]|nr:hypothetical protein DL765_002249 [Monosporascus sp. GIB2]
MRSLWPGLRTSTRSSYTCGISRGIADYRVENGIAIEAYWPLVRNTKTDDETLVGIADKHGISPNQVLMRIGAPNDVFRFGLGSDDMTALDSLDQGCKGAIVMAVEK